MNTTILEKLNTNISCLQKEIELLRSLVIGIITKDKEGKYRPEFVRKMLTANRQKANLIFKDKKSFLSQIKKI